jgi:hypothetical protein
LGRPRRDARPANSPGRSTTSADMNCGVRRPTDGDSHPFPVVPRGVEVPQFFVYLAKVIRKVAEVTPTGVPILRLIDSTPVPCGMSARPRDSDLAGQAGYGQNLVGLGWTAFTEGPNCRY